MPEVQGRWARLAKEGAGRDYRSVGEKEAGGWGGNAWASKNYMGHV